jgi:putative SOS response-associated peptidase YedK
MCFSIQIDKDLKKLAANFHAQIAKEEFLRLQDLLAKNPHLNFKTPNEDGKVFPNYFAPIIIAQQESKIIVPMRYRIRPNNSRDEIPIKFNVFNARLDSLEIRNTWKPLFTRKHGLVPYKRFYEWVEDEKGKKKLISFFPDNNGMMLSPCLFDYWIDPALNISFFSFAIITTEPPKEILDMGHDRCPILLREENINEWLNIKDKNRAYELLREQRSEHFQFEWA